MKSRSKGIGIDVVEIQRIQQLTSAARERFLTRTFTYHERVYCARYHNSNKHFAGTFAAKEAILKAVGGKSHLTDFEIRRTIVGKFCLLLTVVILRATFK